MTCGSDKASYGQVGISFNNDRFLIDVIECTKLRPMIPLFSLNDCHLEH